MRRSLTYYWRIHLCVVLGIAVATAVLTGALLVGDSVRGSLRDLSIDRLGNIDHALISQRFFRSQLAQDLAQIPEFSAAFKTVVPAVILNGTAAHAQKGTRAARVQIQGIDERFAELFNTNISALTQKGAFPPVLINQALQTELNAQIGDPLLLSFERPSDLHRESLFGRNDMSETVQTLRLTISGTLPDRRMGRFGLRAHQHTPLNAFVFLPTLQKALGQPDRVNALLVAGAPEAGMDLQSALATTTTLDDLGLVIRRGEDHVSIESTQFILTARQADAIQSLAAKQGIPHLPILTYLANTIRVGNRTVPYSTISGLNVQPSEKLTLQDESPAPPLGDQDIFLNAWTAKDLDARPGDQVEITYFEVDSKERLATQQATFRLKGITSMTGLGADPTLSPQYPGLQESRDMSAWDAPFPVDFSRIRPKDEAYWDTYQAAPKAFVSVETAQKIWQSRFGVLTSIRLYPETDATAQTIQTALQQKISPHAAGLIFQPVKQQGLTSASGATDFSGLFIGFSQFLIVSAALLVGLLFRLGVEQRAGEIGILMASGYTGATVQKRFMGEALLLAGPAGLLGLIGAALYAWAMIVGLKTWWVAAVGTSELYLHIAPLSLILGYVISLFVVLFAIWQTIRRLGRVPVRTLLSGAMAQPAAASRRRTKALALICLLLAVGCIVGAMGLDPAASVGLFFGSGALLLISGLSFLSLWFRRPRHIGLGGLLSMGIRNSARQPGRSLLCVSLIGCACFVIVAVGANRRTDPSEGIHRASGTGGFSLAATVDVPLYHNLNTTEGLFSLGFSENDARLLTGAKIMPFRTLPGEDISCLNLYQPQTPRVLGVPEALIQQDGFLFQQTLTKTDKPWTLLNQDLGPNVIPAFGDANSVQWILHKQLGDEIVLQNETGQPVNLRLVGLLKTSIFQSELLISETHFQKHFPDHGGYGYFLIETNQPDSLTVLLEQNLKEAGLDAMSTAQKLAHFHSVENTYLATFQTLGGLGLLLGTLGLSIVLLRNAIERRGELATLRAFGFRQSRLSKMLLVENGFLIFTGLVIGSLAALITAAPHITGGALPITSLVLTLCAIFGIGLITSAIAAWIALRTPLLAALKREGI